MLLILIKLTLVLSSANLPSDTPVNKSQIHSLIHYSEVNPVQHQWCSTVRASTNWKPKENSLKALALLQVHTAINDSKLDIKIYIISKNNMEETSSALIQIHSIFLCYSVEWTESISQNHRMVELGRDLWRSCNTTLLLKEGSPRAGCTGLHPGGFWKSRGNETAQPLWAVCSSALLPSK